MDILVVSEDPHYITAVHGLLQPKGARVVGCLGPARSHCPLEQKRTCPMADHSQIVIVDTPPSGAFGKGEVGAGDYAERLHGFHPNAFVLLCGAMPGASGAAGEVSHVADRLRALSTVEVMLDAEG